MLVVKTWDYLHYGSCAPKRPLPHEVYRAPVLSTVGGSVFSTELATSLAHRISRWLLDFWKICAPLHWSDYYGSISDGRVCEILSHSLLVRNPVHSKHN